MVAQSTRRNRSGGRQMESGNSTSAMMAKPGELVGEYPMSSILLVFGVGLGLGFVLSQAICESTRPETMSERWGRSMYDSLSNMVPEAVSRRFSS